jgi:hypothetical protein
MINGPERWRELWLQGNASTDTSLTNIQRGVLFKYNQSFSIYKCPTGPLSVTGADSRTRSVSMSIT